MMLAFKAMLPRVRPLPQLTCPTQRASMLPFACFRDASDRRFLTSCVHACSSQQDNDRTQLGSPEQINTDLFDVPTATPAATGRQRDNLPSGASATSQSRNSRDSSSSVVHPGDAQASAHPTYSRNFDDEVPDRARRSMALRSQLLADDTEAALIGAFLPAEQRECYFTLRALNAETARVIDGARGNAQMASVRYRFWADCVRSAFRSDAAALEHPHPFARQLRAVVRTAKGPLSERLLLRSIEAREAASDRHRQSQTLEDMLQYARDTQSSLLFIALQHAGLGGHEATEAAADHLGQAMGVATLLRSMPHLHARGELQHIPAEAMEHRGLTPELYQVGLERKAPREGASEETVRRYEGFRQQVRDVSFDLAVAGHDQMKAAFAFDGLVKKEALGLLLPAVTTARTYRILEEHDFDLWSEPMAQALAPSRSQLSITAEIARHWLLGRWC